MHQDCVRSAVYSSLIKPLPVACDENETVQCGTTRKAKPSPSVELGLIVHKGRGFQGPDPTPVGCKEEEEAMAYREKSELQLSQISRGAQKLTHMIDSLSKAPNLDGRSKYITEDILRGALDLQESLVMLGKLQEASKVMAERKRKPKLDLREGREGAEEFGVEALGSRRFSFSGSHSRLQEPRLSVDGPSGNCAEELKQVIRGSLHRQNLLSISPDDDKAASSRSLNFSASCRFGDLSYERMRAVGSDFATEQPKKVKSPNLIAKLMGLEEAPPDMVQSIKKEQEKKKGFNSARPSFEIEMPKAMKLQSKEQIPDRKQKTLQEIIETMQFKGLLNNGQVGEQRIYSRFSDISQSEQHGRDVLRDDELPPIVIMKPLHLPCWERGEVQKDLLGKSSVQEEMQSVKLIQAKKVYDHEKMLPKTLERKEVKRMGKTKVELFQKANSLATGYHKQHRKETIGTHKKTNEGQKPWLNVKKQEEKKDEKALRAPISQAKAASEALAKPDKRPSVAKNDVSKQRSTPQDRNLKYLVKPTSQNSTGFIKEKQTPGAKPVRKFRTLTKKVENNKKFEDGKADNSLCPTDGVSTASTLSAYGLLKQPEQENKPCNKDGICKDQKIFCEVMPKSSQGGKMSELAEAVQLPDNRIAKRKSSVIEDSLKRLLLSSQSFLSLARELFGLDAYQPIYFRRKGLEEVVTRNAKLFLDCGKELLAHKSHQRELLNHPFFQAHVGYQTVYTTLDQLVEEISDGMEKLLSYIVADGDATPENSLYIRLERDLRCKEMPLNVMWDIGWRNRICVEESDEVVGDVEEHILSFLIGEILMDLVSG